MKAHYYLLLLLFTTGLAATNTVHGQCEINVSANPMEVICGQSADLTAYGSSTGQVILNEDFNGGGFGSGWGSTPGATNFSNPCSPGGVDGTPHAWMDNNTSVPRTLTSAPYNLSAATAGVTICFDLLFAEQGGSAPCEGPDEPDEGVFLQYSTDGGATWVDIYYFDPNGGNDPQLTNWNNWCFQLPAAAITSNTLIRWHQIADSGADYDHWGIDNVQIFQNDINAEVTWLHDGYSYGLGNPGGVNPNAVTPTTTTTYTAQITTGTGQVCTADITVVVVDPVYDVTVAANPTNICAGDCSDITGTGQIIMDPGGIETYENNEFSLVASGSASVNINVQGINTNNIYDGLIQNVTVNGFNFSGSFLCTSFGGCNCNGSSISFGSTCNLTTSGFTLTLTSPGGCEIILAPAGAATGNYNGTVFVPVGGNVIGGSFPTGGPWAPNQSFSNLNGCDPNGVWTLEFSAPGLGLGIGTLQGWSITFDDPPIYAPVDYSWSPTTGLSNPNDINTQACPVVSTDYELTVSNGTPGCATHTETVSIIVDPCGCVPPTINIDPLQTCTPGTVNLATAINPSSDPATLTYHANQTDAQNDVSPIGTTVGTSGSYWVRAEDPTDPSCFVVVEIQVTINPLDDPSFTLTNYCAGSANGASAIATPGGSFAFNPVPSDGATINAATGEITGGVSGTTYTVEYTTNGPCPASQTQTVTVSSMSYSASVTDESCGAGNGEISLTPNGGTAPYTYTVGGTTQSTSTFSGLAAGNYTVQITDNNGCSVNGSELVANLGGPTIQSLTPTNPDCPGACNGEITAAVTGGNPPYTYQWFDGTGNPIGTNAATITGLCAGNYSLEVSDAAGGTTQLFYEDFNTGAASWTLNVPLAPEGTDPNYFEIDDDEGGVAPGGCGVAGNGDPTLHITSEFNPAGGAAYDAGGLCGFLFCPESHRQAESPMINTVGQTGLTLSFDFIANGDIPNDQATVWYNTGSGWVQLGGALFSGTGGCGGQGLWTAYSSALPAACENIPNLRIAIRWDNNDDGVGTDPSVAINNVEITTAQGASCSVTSSTTLTDPAAADASFTFANFCAGGTNGPSTIATAGGSFAFNPVPSDGAIINATTGVISNAVSGSTYTVEYTVGGPCPVTATQNVTASGITFTSATVGENCGAADGEITLNPTSGTAPFTYSLNAGPTQAGSTFTGLSAGSYTANITDATGCSTSGTVIVSAIGGPSINSIIAVDPTCNGACDGSITVQVSGGTPPYSFQWYDDLGNPIGTNSDVLSNACAGDYSVEVTDANGGSAGTLLNTNSDFEQGPGGGCNCATGYNCGNDAGQVFDGANPVFVVGNQGCISGATNYTNVQGANSGTGYMYFYAGLDQIATNSISFAGGEQVELCVFYTGPQGSGASGQNTANSHFSFGIDGVQVGPDVPVPVNTPWTQFCFTVTMTAGNHTFNILSGGAAQYSIWFDDFEVTDISGGSGGGGCPVTINETLIDPAVEDASFTTTDFCEGTANAAGGIVTPGGTFAFNPVPSDGATIDSATGEVLNGVGGTTYTIEYTVGTAGCTNSTTQDVTVFAAPAPVITGTLTYCAGGSTTLDAGPGYTDYLWSTNELTQTISTTAQTGITVTVSDANGCTGTSAAVDVTETIIAIQLDASTDPGCGQPDGSITVSATGGDGNYAYSLDGAPAVASGQFDNLLAGTYQITVTDGSGLCSDLIDVTLTQINGPSITAVNAADVACFGDSNGTADVEATGTAPLTYELSDGTTVMSNQTGDFSGLAAGNYVVTVTDAGGCSETDNLVINEPAALQLNPIVIDETCSGSCNGQLNWTAQGGTAPYTLSIDGVSSAGNETNLCSGDYVLGVTDDSGCQRTIQVTVNSGEVISIDDVLVINDGCTDACDGSIAVAATNAVHYTLDGVANGLGAFTDLCSGTYTIEVESPNGCTASQVVTVGGSDPVIADFTFDPKDPTMFDSEVNFDNLSYNADAYAWTISGAWEYSYVTDEESFSHMFPTDTGSYEVCLVASNLDGCMDTLCQIVLIVDELVLFVPNTFTPDGDEFNQNLLASVYGADIYDFHMQIFDRWGELIWESNNSSIGWDGTYLGRPVQSGTYTWKIVVKDVHKDDRKTFVGHVNVLR